MENKSRIERDEFRNKVREEWKLMWQERFDDRVRAEGIVTRDYPLVFMNRGFVIFASRGAEAPSFSDVVDFWTSQGLVYSPDPSTGGWGKFIRTHLKSVVHSRAREFRSQSKPKEARQQLKKGGKGWLHFQ